MAWAQVAAIALPYILSSMQDKPDAPVYPGGAQLPDRGKYLDSILNAGFTPQTDLYNQSVNVVADKIERDMGRRGIGASSIANSAKTNALTELANKYMENELERKMKAMDMVSRYDLARADLENQGRGAMYKSAWDNYQDQVRRQQQGTAGLTGMAQAGLGIYQQNQAANQRQANFDQLMTMMNNSNSPQAPMTAPPTVMPSTPPPQNSYSLGVDYGSLGGY